MNIGLKNPWWYARKAKRDYITPEDIDEAVKAGALRPQIMQHTLSAIEDKRAEDVTLCAFMALNARKGKKLERIIPRPTSPRTDDGT